MSKKATPRWTEKDEKEYKAALARLATAQEMLEEARAYARSVHPYEAERVIGKWHNEVANLQNEIRAIEARR